MVRLANRTVLVMSSSCLLAKFRALSVCITKCACALPWRRHQQLLCCTLTPTSALTLTLTSTPTRP